MNSYELSREYFDWCFDNPDRIRPIHTAIYFFAIEHCNRLGWKKKFGFPSQMVMEAIGVKNWRTYSRALNELVDFGFIQMIELSKNQYSSNIIAIVNNTKAPTKATTKALDKALQKHGIKQGQSTVSIDKQYNKEQYNKEQYNKEQGTEISLAFDLLKLEKTEAINIYEMQNKKLVSDWGKLIKAFNNKIDLELAQNKINFEAEELLPRFRGFADNWISNEKKNSYQNNNQQPATAPERF